MTRRLAALLTCLGLSACSGYFGLSPYRMDVQQGNYVSQDMVSKLRPGMTRDQVRFVLGTPLVADLFHADRWDYVYRMEKRGNLKEERKLTVVFEADKLVRVEGDVVGAGPGGGSGTPAR